MNGTEWSFVLFIILCWRVLASLVTPPNPDGWLDTLHVMLSGHHRTIGGVTACPCHYPWHTAFSGPVKRPLDPPSRIYICVRPLARPFFSQKTPDRGPGWRSRRPGPSFASSGHKFPLSEASPLSLFSKINKSGRRPQKIYFEEINFRENPPRHRKSVFPGKLAEENFINKFSQKIFFFWKKYFLQKNVFF